MPEQTGQERTEEATSRRKSEARKEGNVARSQDLTAAITLLAGVVLLAVIGERLLASTALSMASMLGGEFTSNPTRIESLSGAWRHAVALALTTLAPFGLTLMGVAIVAVVCQVGFMLTGKPIVPKLSKLDPIAGTKRLADARAFMRLVMSMGKLVLIAVVSGLFIAMDARRLLAVAQLDPGAALAAAAWMVFMLALKLAAILMVLAILDYLYQRQQTAKDLRMTKEEVKREMKDMDGDPLVKQRRARVARQLAMQRIAQSVPKADVVVTNPTHYAVALSYDGGTMRAPKVVAKGADFMAMRIRQIALANGVPLVERKPLARALYSGVEIGQEVPEEHYAAVAEVLAYVYRLAGRSVAA
ncbi:MAG: flagellar biosynthesis protein FlhB [Planctomycetota bacterium]